MVIPSRGPSRGPTDRSNADRLPQEKPPQPDVPPKQELAPPSPGNRPASRPDADDDKIEDLPENWDVAYTSDGHMYFIE